ncbi:Gag polyprotein [Labeo rohita]|uniref:Gag polyprotein n=1 Tax=Labeo rohita TaxID=84645 RepID=A0ABQ8MUZ9_LABRO|nr:Gag polyprotein [Labeo rohita]
MAESPQNNCYGSALRPTTERHGTEPPNVTIDQMLDNLNVYLDKRLGLRKCHDDMCQRYSIKHSESGQWALSDIKRAYGKTQCLWTNTKKDGLSVVLVKQILQHLQKCETDKQQHWNQNLQAAQLTVMMNLQSTRVQATRNTKVRLAPVIVKNRWTEVEIDNEEEYEENDGVMIVNVNLRDNDQKRLTESAERKIGDSQVNIEDGWEAVQTFLFELKPVEVNWGKITSCMQKTGESVAEFEERFMQTWTEHAGVNNNSEDLSKDTSMPLKATFVNGLKPEISQALKMKYDDWDSIGTTFIQIFEWSAKIERTQDVKLRALQSKTLYNNRTTGYKKSEYQTYSKTKPQGRCRNCNEEGHWHQLATSHPKAYGLHVYVNKTREDTIEKGKAYTETSATEAKDDVLEGSAANQAVKERGPHTVALRQLKPHRQQGSKQMQNEECKEVSSLIEIGVEQQDDNQGSEGNHKEATRILCPSEHVQGQPMSNENPTSDSLVQNDERLSLAVHSAKNQVLTSPKRDHGMVKTQKTHMSQQESRWQRPLEDHLVTDAAVKVQGNNEWIDVNLPRDEG